MHSDKLWSPYEDSYLMGTRYFFHISLFLRIKCPGHEADHSPPSADVKDALHFC
jgi:hypothetical protein